jgi:hypothetical protein
VTLSRQILADPSAYCHQLDPANGRAFFIEMSREDYRAASFLDQRILKPATVGAWSPLSDLAEAIQGAQPTLPLHYIFHFGHVGSTLLSRLLEEAEGVLALREPLPLRTLAQLQDAADQNLDQLLIQQVTLWSRGWPETKAVILKATSTTARLGSRLLANSQARAVYLGLKLEPFLATLLAGENTPIDLNGHAAERAQRLQRLANTTLPKPTSAMSLGELSAMAWVTESLTHADLARAAGDRLLYVDFEQMLADLRTTLATIGQHFAITLDADAAARSPALTRYAKAPEYRYTPRDRAQILAEARTKHAAEIAAGNRWIDEMAARSPAIAALTR